MENVKTTNQAQFNEARNHSIFFNFVTVKINRDKRKGITSDINRPKFAKKNDNRKEWKINF
jgi:hypothetical protein